MLNLEKWKDKLTSDDSPIKRVEFIELTHQERDTFLEGIRERGLRLFNLYKEKKEEQIRVKCEKLANKLIKQIIMLERDLNKFSVLEGMIVDRINKISSLIHEGEVVRSST